MYKQMHQHPQAAMLHTCPCVVLYLMTYTIISLSIRTSAPYCCCEMLDSQHHLKFYPHPLAYFHLCAEKDMSHGGCMHLLSQRV